MSKWQVLVLVIAVGLMVGFLAPIVNAVDRQHVVEQILLALIPATAGIVLIFLLRRTGR